MLASQESAKPTRKIAATGIAGALGIVIAYVLGVDEETAGAIAVVLIAALGAGYSTKDARP